MVFMKNSTSSFSDLVRAANNWRKSVITKLWMAIEVMGDRIVVDDDVIGSIFVDFLAVSHRPTDNAFSNRDIQHFIDHFENRKNEYREQLDDLRQQSGSWAKAEITDRMERKIRSSYMLTLLNEEKTRRIIEENTRLETERAEHQAWLDKQRDKYTLKPKSKRIPNHAPHANKSLGNGLEALINTSVGKEIVRAQEEIVQAQTVLENRKQGKFTSSRQVKKAELSNIIVADGGIAALTNSGEYTLPDFRKVTLSKSGAVTRYTLHE
jgi:hypothetical protein